MRGLCDFLLILALVVCLCGGLWPGETWDTLRGLASFLANLAHLTT